MELATGELIMYGLVAFVMSIVSGIAGAGGGFVMTPLLIFLGLSPAQAVATGKISGLAVTVGSLHGLKTHKVKNKKLIFVVMAMALVIGLLSPFVIKNLEAVIYRRILGAILLFAVPILLVHKQRRSDESIGRWRRVVGMGALIAALTLQAIFSGGLGSLVNIVLITLLGLSPIDANVTKRYSQLLLNAVIVLGVVGSGLIVWQVAIIGVVIAIIGGFIGSKIALKRGDVLIRRVLVVLVIIAAMELLLG